jgi:hypothetical protein
MTEAASAPAPARPRAAGRCARLLGALSLLLFFVPLVAPLVQAVTLAWVLAAAWRGSIDRVSVLLGAAGAALGFLLFLATEFVWIV